MSFQPPATTASAEVSRGGGPPASFVSAFSETAGRESGALALAVERAAVLEELFSVVAREDEERLALQPKPAQALHEPADLGIHPADRAVVPGAVELGVRVGIDLRLLKLVAARHPEGLEQRV